MVNNTMTKKIGPSDLHSKPRGFLAVFFLYEYELSPSFPLQTLIIIFYKQNILDMILIIYTDFRTFLQKIKF